ncbi:MAG: helix-hairpin-helix domain-containing protein [Smithella sp.]
MLERQLRGLIVISLVLTIIPLIIFFSGSFSKFKIPILANQYKNSIILDIHDKHIGEGIFFTPPGMTVNQLLNTTGNDFRIKKDFLLENGMKIIIDSSSVNKISLSTINNYHRFALGVPVDLNLATKDDLMIIPGIGEKTAEKILVLRNKKGRFKNIEELMEIKGIKEKKLAKFKKYLSLKK